MFLGDFPISELLCTVGLGLARGRNVLGASAFQDLFRFLRPLGIVRVNRQQNPAIFYSPFIPFGFVFWDSHSDQGSREAADCAPHACTGERRHNRSGSDERTKTWYRKSTNTRQPSQPAAEQCARSSTGRGSFRCLRVLLVSKIFCASALGKQDRDVTVSKFGRLQSVHSTFYARLVCVNSKNRCIFSCHVDSPLSSTSYCCGWMFSSLVTLPSPATSLAFASIARFSSSDRTGPFSVT